MQKKEKNKVLISDKIPYWRSTPDEELKKIIDMFSLGKIVNIIGEITIEGEVTEFIMLEENLISNSFIICFMVNETNYVINIVDSYEGHARTEVFAFNLEVCSG